MGKEKEEDVSIAVGATNGVATDAMGDDFDDDYAVGWLGK